MAAPAVWLPAAGEMAAIDRAAIDSGAIPERALIENAGRSLARHLQERHPSGRVLVLAGSGHNGADALVAGRTVAAWGRDVGFVQCGSRPPSPDVLAGWDFALKPPDAVESEVAISDVAVDGILGTGLVTAPRRRQAEIIERVNSGALHVVAADGPSGVDFSTGRVPGAAVRAGLTVTFGWPKIGLLAFPAREFAGDLVCVEIGFPPPSPGEMARAVTASWAASLLGGRSAAGHKGDAGYLVIAGGESGMAGAAILAARAAIRAGAGVVRVVSDPDNREILQTAVPEAIFVGWDDSEAVDAALQWADALALGPGLGRDPRRTGLVRRFLGADAPLVVDADGLNVLAELSGAVDGAGAAAGAASVAATDDEAWSAAAAGASSAAVLGEASGDDVPGGIRLGPERQVLLTPHPGEMARLLGRPADAEGSAPAANARRLASEYGATVVLKGVPTWVAAPDGELRATTMAGAGFASGGMGDVLTGVCGAYMAAGLGPADAATAALAVTAVAVHEGVHDVGGSAADVPSLLPQARDAVMASEPGAWPGVLLALPALSGGSRTGVAPGGAAH